MEAQSLFSAVEIGFLNPWKDFPGCCMSPGYFLSDNANSIGDRVDRCSHPNFIQNMFDGVFLVLTTPEYVAFILKSIPEESNI